MQIAGNIRGFNTKSNVHRLALSNPQGHMNVTGRRRVSHAFGREFKSFTVGCPPRCGPVGVTSPIHPLIARWRRPGSYSVRCTLAGDGEKIGMKIRIINEN